MRIKKILAVLLSVLLACSAAVMPVKAAEREEKTTAVSELNIPESKVIAVTGSKNHTSAGETNDLYYKDIAVFCAYQLVEDAESQNMALAESNLYNIIIPNLNANSIDSPVIALGYQTTNDWNEAIKDVVMHVSDFNDSPEELTFHNRTYLRCPCYTVDYTYFTELYGDLDCGARGKFVHLYYTKEPADNDLKAINNIFTDVSPNGSVVNIEDAAQSIETAEDIEDIFLHVSYYTPSSFNITYINSEDGLNGVKNTNTTNYNADSGDITLTNPTREGYVFGGWYNNAEFTGEAVTGVAISSGSVGNKTFYAKWILNDNDTSTDNDTDDFEWTTKNDGTLTITKYTGSAAEVTIPSEIDGKSVTSIGYEAFSDCTNLTSITIPDSVTSIGKDAFSYCESLTSITIPDSVTSIGESTFKSCRSLTDVYYTGNKTQWEEITIGNDNDSLVNANIHYLSGASFIPPLTTPDDFDYNPDGDVIRVKFYCGTDTVISVPSAINGKPVTTITKGSTEKHDSMERVTKIYIPDSVTTIGANAFSKYSALEEVVIPDSVTEIGANAFADCPKLKTIVVPDNVTSIGLSAFSHCTGLTSVKIPDSVKSIDKSAFHTCENLTEVTIPESVTKIEDGTFNSCRSLTAVTIPKSVVEIGSKVFESCKSLKDIYYGGNEARWNSIDNKSKGGFLEEATIHFNNDDDFTGSDTPELKLGDVNNDGKITAKDSMAIQRHTINLKKLDDTLLKAADVNGDGKVSNKDALAILRFTIGYKVEGLS